MTAPDWLAYKDGTAAARIARAGADRSARAASRAHDGSGAYPLLRPLSVDKHGAGDTRVLHGAEGRIGKNGVCRYRNFRGGHDPQRHGDCGRAR